MNNMDDSVAHKKLVVFLVELCESVARFANQWELVTESVHCKEFAKCSATTVLFLLRLAPNSMTTNGASSFGSAITQDQVRSALMLSDFTGSSAHRSFNHVLLILFVWRMRREVPNPHILNSEHDDHDRGDTAWTAVMLRVRTRRDSVDAQVVVRPLSSRNKRPEELTSDGFPLLESNDVYVIRTEEMLQLGHLS